MENSNILRISHIIVAVIMIGLILLQNRNEGQTGFLQGGGESFKTRRGIEKIIFYVTVVFALAFVVLTIVILKTS